MKATLRAIMALILCLTLCLSLAIGAPEPAAPTVLDLDGKPTCTLLELTYSGSFTHAAVAHDVTGKTMLLALATLDKSAARQAVTLLTVDAKSGAVKRTVTQQLPAFEGTTVVDLWLTALPDINGSWIVSATPRLSGAEPDSTTIGSARGLRVDSQLRVKTQLSSGPFDGLNTCYGYTIFEKSDVSGISIATVGHYPRTHLCLLAQTYADFGYRELMVLPLEGDNAVLGARFLTGDDNTVQLLYTDDRYRQYNVESGKLTDADARLIPLQNGTLFSLPGSTPAYTSDTDDQSYEDQRNTLTKSSRYTHYERDGGQLYAMRMVKTDSQQRVSQYNYGEAWSYRHLLTCSLDYQIVLTSNGGALLQQRDRLYVALPTIEVHEFGPDLGQPPA